MGRSKRTKRGRPREGSSDPKRADAADTGDAGAAGSTASSGDGLSPRRRWAHVGLAALGGLMQCLGFAGFSWWPFALVCFLPMFYVLDAEPKASNRRVLGLGFIHGFVGYTGGYYWLVEMLEVFSGFPRWACWAMASVFFAYHGAQQMLIYWLYRRARRHGFRVTTAAVPALLTMELLHPVLFPSYLATGFHDVTTFIQTADLGGPMLISAVVMAVNGALYELARAAWRRERLPRLVPAIAAAGVLATLGYGTWRISEVDARSAEARILSVGVVQVNMGIFSKREDPYEGHQRHVEQSQRLEAAHDMDLLVWPESAYTFFLPDGMRDLRRVLGPIRTPLLFGGLRRREGPDRTYAYNTAYLTSGEGEVLGLYDKTYLLMFGEYLPFGETFPVLYDWSPHSGRFTPGTHVRPLVLPTDEGDVRMSALVCYEDVIPRFTRQAVREGDPHLLVNITNDAWFGDTHEPWIHLALAKFRAVEHHRALVRSTNSGVSAFVDPVGRVTGQIGVFEQGEMVRSVPLLEGTTVYAHLGDWPGFAALVAMVWMSYGRRRRSRPSAATS